ncbi:MAG: S-adenosylmethionine tRNA ribosyltransferase [Bacteroidetes bacterium GWF2_49_14]|nr:MAG: S-adenosylmethionine tRNA ribosyltransferase [Bacteroidetes bacterium GWF2_49_14]
MTITDIRSKDYSYILPDARIAHFPLKERDQSKLLIFKNNQITHGSFKDLDHWLPTDSLIIWNNTRVIQARLLFRKSTGSPVEVFLLEPIEPVEHTQSFASTGTCVWQTIIGNKKKWKSGLLIASTNNKGATYNLTAELVKSFNHRNLVRLSWDPAELTFAEITEIFGQTPIPPYLNRVAEDIDKIRYQTVYARIDGSVAAPTAGLHFSPDSIEKLQKKGIGMVPITLHVGAGTFVPVKADSVADHSMHTEVVLIPKAAIEKLISLDPVKITAVGTTTIRTLESLYWLGVKLASCQDWPEETPQIDQWDPYTGNSIPETQTSLENVIRYMNDTGKVLLEFSTRLMIIPGYQFRIAKRLITNFHQPGSTLLLLVAAFTGGQWKEIYQYALDHEFRFLSYGDSSLLELAQ